MKTTLKTKADLLVADRPPLAYSTNAAATLIGISRATLYVMMNDGRVPSIRVGGRRLITAETLQNILKKGA